MDEKLLRLMDRINEISSRITDLEERLRCSTCPESAELKAMNFELDSLRKTLKNSHVMLTALSHPPTDTHH